MEYAPKRIFINAVSPHMVQTKFLQDMDERLVENLAAADPLGRHLTPGEVVEAIEFLFSDEIPIWGKNLVICFASKSIPMNKIQLPKKVSISVWKGYGNERNKAVRGND